MMASGRGLARAIAIIADADRRTRPGSTQAPGLGVRPYISLRPVESGFLGHPAYARTSGINERSITPMRALRAVAGSLKDHGNHATAMRSLAVRWVAVFRPLKKTRLT